MSWKKVFASGVYSALLWACSAALGNLLNNITGGPPGNVRNDTPFFESWWVGTFLVGWSLIDLWYVFPLFGAWATYFPPRRWWAWLVFSLASVGAGLLASRDFQALSTWDYELADHNIVSPPAGTLSIYANLLCCVTALVSNTLGALVVRRWLDGPPSSTP